MRIIRNVEHFMNHGLWDFCPNHELDTTTFITCQVPVVYSTLLLLAQRSSSRLLSPSPQSQ